MQLAFRNFIIGTLILCLYFPGVNADVNKVKDALEDRLGSLDSELLDLSKSDAMSSRRIKDAEGPFRKAIKEYPEFQTLMRTNSKGKVVNEIVSKGRPGRKFRDVSNQSWFGETAKMDPYYGFLKMRDGTTYLFWCKPIPVSTREGGYRFGGALVAKIELSDVFEAVAKKSGEPFKLTKENETIYSNAWKNIENAASENVSIKGLDQVMLEGKKPVPQKAAVDSQAVNQAAKTASASPADSEKKEEKSGGFPWLPILLLVVFAGGGGYAFVTFRKAAKKRHAAILAEIEGDDQAGEEGGVRNELGFDEGATVIMPTPRKEMQQHAAMGRAQQQSDKAFHSTQSNEQTIQEEPSGPSFSGPSQEMYNRIRQEVFQEMKGRMDEQFKKQLYQAIAAKSESLKHQIFAQAQQSFARNIQAYSSILAQQIHTLSTLASQSNIPEQSRLQALNSVINELKRIQSSMSGNSQSRSSAR